MWHKAEWMVHPMRIELTRVDLFAKLLLIIPTEVSLNSVKCICISHFGLLRPAVSAHMTALQFVLYFTSSLFLSVVLSVNVSSCSYLLMMNNSITRSCAHITFIYWWLLIICRSAQISNKKEQDGVFNISAYEVFFGWGVSRGVMVKATDCGIVVSAFALQSC